MTSDDAITLVITDVIFSDIDVCYNNDIDVCHINDKQVTSMK